MELSNLYINKDGLLVASVIGKEHEVIAVHDCGFTFIQTDKHGSSK